MISGQGGDFLAWPNETVIADFFIKQTSST